MKEKYNKLREYLDESRNFTHITSLLYWDMETGMPREGFKGHSDALAYFSTEQFKRDTAPEFEKLVDDVLNSSEMDSLSREEQFIVRKTKENMEIDKRIPVDFYEDFVREQSECGQAWQDAKRASDFSIYAPHLEKMIEMTKQMAKYRHPELSVYDSLLDQYEAGMDMATIDELFSGLKQELCPLIDRIIAAKQPDDTKFKNKKFDKNAQKKVEKLLLEYIGFSYDRGTTGETEHPFTLNMSRNDVRVSNHFHEDDATDYMFTAIHEGGHAIFEQNVAENLDGTVGGSCSYMGIHESQSRFYENILGRNKNFWIPIYDKIQALVPELQEISLDEFYHEINHVRNSYIRTMADEVTYCLHIIIRYEIEKEIFINNVSVNDLPGLWNKKMEEYLHIVPKNDGEGILQDMHWSDGSFGYFPTYLLGSIYDGMYLEAIEEDLGPIDPILKSGNILTITKWLNEHIHKYGSTRLPKEVIGEVCKKPLSYKPLMKYFTLKYTEVYHL